MYIKRKYQVGGIAYTPYLPAQAGSPQESASTATAGSSSGSKSEKISGTIKGEIVKLLQENGIPSDVSVFLKYADNFLAKSQTLSQFSLFGGNNDDYDMSDLIRVQQLVNDVKYNKELRDEAVKHVTSESAGSEVAITDSGYIYAFNSDKKLTKITPKEYSENKDNYQILTNSQLMYFREHQPDLAFQTDILNDLQNTIGMNSITKYLRDTINAFGSDKLQGYTTKDKEVNNGLQLLMQSGPDGFYKFTKEEELRDVNRALRYLYNGMSDNAKNLLKAKTAVEGGDPSDPNDISNLLLQALYENTSRTLSVDFDQTATKFDGSSNSSGNGSDDPKNLKEYNYIEKLAAGQNSGLPEQMRITYDGATVDMNIIAWNVGNIVKNKEEDNIGSGMLDAIRQDSYGLDQAANQATVQFGDQEFDKNAQSTIFYDNTPMYRTKMPATRNNKGEIIVDWNAVRLVNEMNERLQGTEYTPEMLQRLLQETDPRLYIDQNGQIAWADDAWFLTFEGIVANNYENNLNTDSPWIQKVSREEERQLKEKYENANKYGYTNPNNGTRERVGRNRKQGQFIINWMNHDLYRSKVFMPITRPLAGSSEYYPAATHMDNTNTAMARQQQVQTQKEVDMGLRKFNF